MSYPYPKITLEREYESLSKDLISSPGSPQGSWCEHSKLCLTHALQILDRHICSYTTNTKQAYLLSLPASEVHVDSN